MDQPVDPADPESITTDIYDEIANLEKWQEMLSDMISTNNISQEEFDNEMLKSNYYLDIRTKTYVIDEDDQEIINKLDMFKKSLTENFKMGIIDEKEFNTQYINIIRKEYEILKMSEVDEKDAMKVDTNIDLPLETKLKMINDAETKYNLSIAKKYNIPVPVLPPNLTEEMINDFVNQKIVVVGKTDDIELYLEEVKAFNQRVGYYTSSFKVLKPFYDTESGKTLYSFKKIAPISSEIEEFYKIQKRSALLSPQEQIYSDKLTILKSRLRQLSRDELLECVGVRTFKYMSYIERLKENKQNVFRFKEHPENYEKLNEILNEDSKMYKIDSNEIFKDYLYSRPDVFQNSQNEDKEDISSYQQKGQISYLAIKPGADLNNLSENLDDYETIKPMSDELYNQLKETDASGTTIAKTWELRISLPGSTKKNIVKRYLSFDDYLKDLKNILVNNSKKLTGKSKDIINSKIRKINYYLQYGEDIESYSPSGQMTVEEIFNKRSEIYEMRSNGLYTLMEYITLYYPGINLLIEKLESDIYDYSTKNYKYNIDKVLFILKNYQEKLEELVEGDLSIIEILTYEIPMIIPDNDLGDLSDKNAVIQSVLEWNPDTSKYDIYKNELISNGHNFTLFKKQHTELSNLYISEIMSQYSESKLWERSKDAYRKLEVPNGYIEENFRLRHILRERNKLPSRRIFKVTTIDTRIETQRIFNGVFKDCRVPEPEKYSILTENLIYGLCRLPEDYMHYTKLVRDEYKKLCSYFSKLNLNCKLNEEGTVKCIISFEPNVLTPAITEFLITQGDFNTVDINRLSGFLETNISDKVNEYIRNIRGDELRAYNQSALTQLNIDKSPINEIYFKASRILISNLKKNRIEQLTKIVSNTYKPPVTSLEKPVKTLLGIKHEIENIKVQCGPHGCYYVYGGYYPNFNSYADDGSIDGENYTREDLEDLARLYNVEIGNLDNFELYTSIMKFIGDQTKVTVNETPKYNPTEYNYRYLNAPDKTIYYAIRPRLGVPEPGEAYAVTKSDTQLYGVPFSFNKDTIPIYAEQLKERVANGFLIIEGPSIFQKTDEYNAITSNYYIKIEYLNSRGKPVTFKEGVAEKKVLKRKEKTLQTCSRFTEERTCNNINSYSLDIKGLKYKCRWLKKYIFDQEFEVCEGTLITENPEIKDFNVSQVTFESEEKNKLWRDAIESSINYIEEIVKIKEITTEEITILSKEQKAKLFEYYNFLMSANSVVERQSAEDTTSEVKSYSLIDEFSDILKRESTPFEVLNEDDDYKTVTIYKEEVVQMKLPIKVVLGREYTINGIQVIPTSYNFEDKTYTCNIKGDDEVVIIEKEEFVRKTSTLITKPKPIFCLVDKKNYGMLNNYLSYSWTLKTVVYEKRGDDIVKIENTETKKFVPTSFINPSDVINGKSLITRDDILNAMYRTAYCTLTSSDNIIYNVIEKINAQEDAIKFAITNNVDIIKLQSRIVGNIDLVNVVEEYERLNPKKIMNKTELTNILREAIDRKDKKTLMDNYVRGRKNFLDKELLKEVKELIKTLPDEAPKEEPKVITKKIVPKSSVKFTSQKRR